MLNKFSDREKYGLAGVFAFSLVAAFGARAVASPGMTGSFTGDTGGEASQQEIEQKVQTIMDQQIQRQQQQLAMAANQSENLTMDDLSISSEVQSVSASDFDSLYRVEVSTTGQIPERRGGTTSLDESQVLYISTDGRYLFQEPTDLEQTQQQQQPQRPQAPSAPQ